MFHTDWLGVLVVFVFVALSTIGVRLIVRSVPPVPQRRRPSTPQRGAAAGTGVECEPQGTAASDAALPRSPQDPAAVDPRPAVAGLVLPAGTVDAPHAVPAGHQRRRETVHG